MESGLHKKPVVGIFRSPLFNASETFVQSQAATLRRYQPVLIGMEDHGNGPVDIPRALPRSGVERVAFKLLGHCGGLVERLRAASPALLHAHFGTDGVLALPLARALTVPLVTTLHGYEISRGTAHMLLSGRLSWMKYSLAKRRLMAGGQLFLAVSNHLRQRAIAQGYPPERTVTHYVGVDLARFRSDGETAQPGSVLHVGRLVEKKGTGTLLRAFAQVKKVHEDATLTIIGDGLLLPRLRRQCAELELGGSVTFMGAQPSEVVADRMRRAWLLAAPSVTAADGDAEGLPTVICEAAAASLPAVATEHAGIPEAVIHGNTGFIVPEHAIEPLAARILDLLNSAALRDAMALAARDLATERFDLARQTSQLEDHYDRLLAGQRRDWIAS
jgi:glycosyltransferase involved in cell wall biosynthesis